MKSLTLINKKILEEQKEYFENFREWGKKIKEIARKFLGPKVKVLIFGSIIKGEWTPESDIDVLIISNKLSKSWIKNRLIRTKIKRLIGRPSPFQLHLARPEEYKSWWQKFIKKDYIEM